VGAEPYWYFEKYDGDVDAVLQALRKREFAAGRYNPVIASMWQLFPIGPPHARPRCSALQHSRGDGRRGRRWHPVDPRP
jgi:hypothetical protein